MRVGIGYDVHPLVEGRRLVLGGVAIAHPRGLAGHSDADALTHAIIDALLGAAGQGDIGQHFPPTDDAYRDISSLVLLRRAVEKLAQLGYSIVNIDSTVIAQEPRLAPHLGAMQAHIAETMGLETARVSVKATSPEGIGALGANAGIAAMAIALIEENEQ